MRNVSTSTEIRKVTMPSRKLIQSFIFIDTIRLLCVLPLTYNWSSEFEYSMFCAASLEQCHWYSRHLRFLNLNNTGLATWDEVDRLAQFPSLRSLRVQVSSTQHLLNLFYIHGAQAVMFANTDLANAGICIWPELSIQCLEYRIVTINYTVF